MASPTQRITGDTVTQYMKMEVDISIDDMTDTLLTECYHVPSKLNAFLERMFEDDAKAMNDFVLGKAPYDYVRFKRALKEVLHEFCDKDVKELSWILVKELRLRELPILPEATEANNV
tara:strand:+ start:3242 stop:3595 length:354 start_codon:yes stop_codon:yes gene_type:complete